MTDDATGYQMRPWRRHHGLSLLRLRVDVHGAGYAPIRRAGDLVLGRFGRGDANIARGWRLSNLGFLCVMDDAQIEVVENNG